MSTHIRVAIASYLRVRGKKAMKGISSEFSCDGKREFSMGCDCGRRNVTEEIERHCQASARIEGGGKLHEKSLILDQPYNFISTLNCQTLTRG